MSFFDGEACPDDNLKGILSIHLKLVKYIHSIKIWKSLDFGIDWLRNGRVIKRPLFVYGRPSGSAGSAFCFPYNSVTVRRILFKFGRFRQ